MVSGPKQLFYHSPLTYSPLTEEDIHVSGSTSCHSGIHHFLSSSSEHGWRADSKGSDRDCGGAKTENAISRAEGHLAGGRGNRRVRGRARAAPEILHGRSVRHTHRLDGRDALGLPEAGDL